MGFLKRWGEDNSQKFMGGRGEVPTGHLVTNIII